jgi:hypothetical protein
MYWPILPVRGDCEDGEVGGMKCGWQGKPKYSEKTCPGAILSTTNPTCQTRARTRAAAVGSQRLTASAMAWPMFFLRKYPWYSANLLKITILYFFISYYNDFSDISNALTIIMYYECFYLGLK